MDLFFFSNPLSVLLGHFSLRLFTAISRGFSVAVSKKGPKSTTYHAMRRQLEQKGLQALLDTLNFRAFLDPQEAPATLIPGAANDSPEEDDTYCTDSVLC